MNHCAPMLLFMKLGWPEITIVVFMFALFGTFLAALVHCIGNSKLNSTHKVLWVLGIFFFPFLGSLIYLILRPVSRENS